MLDNLITLDDFIDLDETGSQCRNVMFNLTDDNIFNYINEYSMTWKINFNNPANSIHDSWIKKINKEVPGIIDSTVEYLSFVFLEMETPGNLPQPIRSLYPKPPSCTDCAFGVVVSVDDNMVLLHRPKRTQGKVSNKLG